MGVDKYIELITKFTDNTIDAKEFEQSFLEMFKQNKKKYQNTFYELKKII
ncbi:colicin immunity domain-containing protein [Capnocytophaga sp. oral taxon 324]|nr:hypothetical protein HMPREF9072_01351 [Capnocytophaga sp. oral taxon 324 str. F0483]